MAPTQFEIVEVLHQFPKTENSIYRKELCIVKWFRGLPKYDLRGWNSDHTKMTRGISLTEEELRELVEFAQDILY